MVIDEFPISSGYDDELLAVYYGLINGELGTN